MLNKRKTDREHNPLPAGQGVEERRSSSILTAWPALDMQEVNRLLEKEAASSDRKMIVLDDDPTGVQTVHDVSVYTDWSMESLRSGFAEDNKLFFILTNSRGFTAEQTAKAHLEIAANVDAAAKEAGMEYLIISRGDSTLRGHYPLETELLRKVQEERSGWKVDGEVLCPFFAEGGRFTIGNVHYVRYGDELVPAGQTEFAKDKTFGYTASDLRTYIEEKTEGAYREDSVTCISIEELRGLRLDEITERLMAVTDFNKIVVNAVDTCDVKVFCIALYRAMSRGKHFMFRTAAAFVKSIGNISDRPLLSREEMVTLKNKAGGIIIVGSHTQRTTAQLEELKKVDGILFIEMDSDLVLQEGALEAEVSRILEISESCIRQGMTVAVYTKRRLLEVEHDTKEAALLRSVRISDAVQSLVGRLNVSPAFVVAKGGITSSDVGTKALLVKRADVLGQIRPGIPVWQTGRESRFPGTPYVIFPGNVGEVETLREAVEVLMGK